MVIQARFVRSGNGGIFLKGFNSPEWKRWIKFAPIIARWNRIRLQCRTQNCTVFFFSERTLGCFDNGCDGGGYRFRSVRRFEFEPDIVFVFPSLDCPDAPIVWRSGFQIATILSLRWPLRQVILCPCTEENYSNNISFPTRFRRPNHFPKCQRFKYMKQTSAKRKATEEN